MQPRRVSLMRSVFLSHPFILAVISVAPARAQRLELPTLTAEQRWDRAAKQVTLFATMFIREGIEAGKTPPDIGRELAEFFGPWSGVVTPADMARSIHRNWQLWRDVEFVAVETADGAVTVTTNRPYAAAIRQYRLIGVAAVDFDEMFGSFHQAIAKQQGLDFQQIVDSGSVRMTIRRAR